MQLLAGHDTYCNSELIHPKKGVDQATFAFEADIVSCARLDLARERFERSDLPDPDLPIIPMTLVSGDLYWANFAASLLSFYRLESGSWVTGHLSRPLLMLAANCVPVFKAIWKPCS